MKHPFDDTANIREQLSSALWGLIARVSAAGFGWIATGSCVSSTWHGRASWPMLLAAIGAVGTLWLMRSIYVRLNPRSLSVADLRIILDVVHRDRVAARHSLIFCGTIWGIEVRHELRDGRLWGVRNDERVTPVDAAMRSRALHEFLHVVTPSSSLLRNAMVGALPRIGVYQRLPTVSEK